MVPGLARAPAHLLERLGSAMTVRRYRRDQILYRTGAAADGLYVLLSGRVRVFRETVGRAQMLHSETSGGVLGEIPVFSGSRFPATAIAVEPTRCGYLPLDVIERLLQQEPEFARFALRRLAIRAQSLLRRIDELTTTTITARVAQHIIGRASEGHGETFTLGISQEALAAELGTAREVVVRALASLVEARAIARRGRARFAIDVRETLLVIAGERLG